MRLAEILQRLLGTRPASAPAASPAPAPVADRPMPDEDAVHDALMTVMDPEAGMNIVDLGLVYGVEIKDDGVHVTMTMTSPACPATEQVVDAARAAIRHIAPRNAPVTVEVVWEPPWTPDRMSEMARQTFGWSGGGRG